MQKQTPFSSSAASVGPSAMCVPGRAARVYGVDYRVFDDPAGGTLYVTRYGLPLIGYLDPAGWYLNRRYITEGQRMTTGTGTVYRLRMREHAERPLDFVVKVSRFAQDVPLDIRSTFDGAIDEQAAERARFLDPFQEFGVLMDLRRGRFGPSDLRICTKRPLAIYRAPVVEADWRLGRKASHLDRALREIEADQAASEQPVSLASDRVYVVLFHWVHGLDLQEAVEAGLLTVDELDPITSRVAHELRAKGFMVLDHKPQHIIVRPAGDGLLRRGGLLPYALIDFELLERTAEYQHHLRARRRSAAGS